MKANSRPLQMLCLNRRHPAWRVSSVLTSPGIEGCAVLLLALFSLAAPGWTHAAVAPTVSAVTASQQAGTKLVNISYDLADPDSSLLSIYVQVSADAGATWNVPVNSLGGAAGGDVTPGTSKSIVWDAGADWDGQYTTQCRVRVLANDANPEGFRLISAGSFNMGDSIGEGQSHELPVHTVTVSAFFMEKSLVTGHRWNAVYNWALTHAYGFDNAGSSLTSTHPISDHPVGNVTWFDAVKWCNARSQLEGRTPCYYTDALLVNVYRSGQVAPHVNWNANGYRLPTEAEWEKAARGGLSGKRFPWGDTITTNQANYQGSTNAYNLSGDFGYHPAATLPSYTTPVALFGTNGFGLYDMAGNVWELCWDWYASDAYNPLVMGNVDPRGPAGPLSERVIRGGAGYSKTVAARCAHRAWSIPDDPRAYIGFRCVRGP